MLDWLIILFCFMAISSAVTTSMSSKIIRSTFFFGVTLFVIAFAFISIGSTLLGVVQILLYTGGTLILFLFAIILTANWDYKNLGETFNKPIRAIVISFIFLGIMSYIISTSPLMKELAENFTINSSNTSKDISKTLFEDWFVILEVASFLLLGTIVGCLTLLKYRKEIS